MTDLLTPARDMISELVEAALRERLVLFVGAGVSRNSGLPTWNELLQTIMTDWPEGLSEVGKVQPLQLTQAFVQKCRGGSSLQVRQELAARILAAENQAALSEVHAQLRRLPVAAIYTTNYDTLLEKAFADSPSLATDDEFATSRPVPGLADIVHLHGSTRSPLSMKATWADFIGFWNDPCRHFLRNRVEHDLHTKTFLFLGYGFRDPHLLALLQELAGLPGQSEWPHYVVFLTPQPPSVGDEAIASSLAALNLRPLTVPDRDSFFGFLKELADQVESRSRESEKREMPAAAAAMAHELTRHITQDDMSVMSDYIERGEYQQAVAFTDRLLDRIRRIEPRDDEVRDSARLLASKKIAYLHLDQQDAEARELLRQELAREPASPWLLAERLRELMIDDDVAGATDLLSHVSRDDRAKVVLFDFFEFHLLLGKNDFARAESLLDTSEALGREKHAALRRTMRVSLYLQRRDLGEHDPSRAAKEIASLKQEVEGSGPALRGKRPSKSDVYELYSQAVIGYVLASPPVPYLSGEHRPFEDFGVADYRELLIAARTCVAHLMSVVKDRRMLDSLHMRHSLFSHWLDLGRSARRRDMAPVPELPSGEIGSALEAFFEARQHLGNGEYEEALDVLGAVNWANIMESLPFNVRLGIAACAAFALGKLSREPDAPGTRPLTQLMDAAHLLGDCDRQDFVALGGTLLRSAHAMGCLKNVGAAADELASILTARPYSLRWLDSIIELLDMFVREAQRRNVPGFFKLFTLSDLDESPGIPDRVREGLWSGEPSGVDATDVAKVKAVVSSARTSLYELLPSGHHLLACAESLLNMASDCTPCREFLGTALGVSWPELLDWSKASLPSTVQELELTDANAATLLFYLGKCAPAHDQAVDVLERAHGMAVAAGAKELASHIAFDLARVFRKRDEKGRETSAFERCLETSSAPHHFLAFAASLIGGDDPKRAWQVLQRGCTVLGERRELVQPMFQLGFRLGHEHERLAIELLQRHPEYFGARRLDIHKDRDEIVTMLDAQRRAEQKGWEYYSWGKRPLVAVAENRGLRLASVWSRLTRIQRLLLFRWPDLARHRFEYGVAQQQQSEVVLDISAILSIAALGIGDDLAGFWTKAVCSNSLWDFVHQEVVATGQEYREERHRSHQRFQAWLGDLIEGMPTARDYWQQTGINVVPADSPEYKGLRDHVISLAWARERRGVWLAIHQPEERFEEFANWNDASRRAVLFPADLVELLTRWGEITAAQKASLDAVLRRLQATTPDSVQRDVPVDRLEHVSRGAALAVSYDVFRLLEEAGSTEGMDILPIVRRCFQVTVSPLDLQEFQQKQAQLDADEHACQLSQKARDVLRRWRQRGFLEVVEPKIRETPGGEYVSAEHLGVPFTEFALATEKQLPLVVDDLGTFEVFHGLLRRSGVQGAHPTTGIPLLVLRGAQGSAGEERDFWFGKMQQLWLWGTHGLPPSGVLAWLLEQTGWNTRARPVEELMEAMTRLVQFRPPSEALTEQDLSEIGVSFTAGIPDPQVAGRLSLFALVKELSSATLSYCISKRRSAESGKAGKGLSLQPLVDLRLQVEQAIRQLEETIIRNAEARSGAGDSSPPEPGLLSRLLPMTMLSAAQMPETETSVADVRFEEKQFLCDCVARILLQGSEYLNPQQAREALVRAAGDISLATAKNCAKVIQDYAQTQTVEKYVSVLIAIKMFLETIVLLPTELANDVPRVQPSLESSALEGWRFIVAEEHKTALQLTQQQSAELEAISLPVETLLLHLAQMGILGFDPNTDVVGDCMRRVEDMCIRAKGAKAREAREYELSMHGVVKSFEVMPEEVRVRFFSLHRDLLAEIGIKVEFPSERLGFAEPFQKLRSQIESHAAALLQQSQMPPDSRDAAARAHAALALANIELALGQCDSPEEAKAVLLKLLQEPGARDKTRVPMSMRFASIELPALKEGLDELVRAATTGQDPEHFSEIDGKLRTMLEEPAVRDDPARFVIVLRRAVRLVSFAAAERRAGHSETLDAILQLGEVQQPPELQRSLIGETELLLHVLRGEALTSISEWRDRLQRALNEQEV